jgi:hypothetical protein
MGAARGALLADESMAQRLAAREEVVHKEAAACINRDAELARRLVAEDAAAHGVSQGAALRAQGGPMVEAGGQVAQTDSKGKAKDSAMPTAAEQGVTLDWERRLSAGTWRGSRELAPGVVQPRLDPVMEAAARAQAMACFAEGRPLVSPTERGTVEGVPGWIDNSGKVVKVMTATGWWAPEKVLLDGGSYYSMAGARLTTRLGLTDADLDSTEHKVQTAIGKVETLKGGLTTQAVPVVLNAGTGDEVCLLEQLAPTGSTGYDLLIGTQAAYPCGLSVDRWTEQGVYRVDWQTNGVQVGKLPMKLHQPKEGKWVTVVKRRGWGVARGGQPAPACCLTK